MNLSSIASFTISSKGNYFNFQTAQNIANMEDKL